MIREHLFNKKAPSDPCFRWRGGDVSRVEGLSDGVFAFALTLLVVSLSVPQNFFEVWITIRDFPAFAMSFAVLIMCWYSNYIFFRRYGLEDFFTMFVNTLILFLVLFYVFPLRFMATLIWRQIIGDDVKSMFALPANAPVASLPGGQTFWLVILYGIGIIGIFGLYLVLKLHALRLRRHLELDRIEIYLTKVAIAADAIWIITAVVSISLSFFSPPLAGLSYCLLGPAQGLLGGICGAKAERMYKNIYGMAPGQVPDHGQDTSTEGTPQTQAASGTGVPEQPDTSGAAAEHLESEHGRQQITAPEKSSSPDGEKLNEADVE